jgi:hypothetical protein
VDEPGNVRVAGRIDGCLGTANRHKLVALTISGDVRLRSEVEHHITARHTVAPRGRVGQLAPHRLGAQCRHLRGRCLTTDQNTHRVPLLEEPAYQYLADEPRAARDECSCHETLLRRDRPPRLLRGEKVSRGEAVSSHEPFPRKDS